MGIDPNNINPEATYTVDFGTVEQAREFDFHTGEIIELPNGGHRYRVKVTGEQLLELIAAGERTRATNQPTPVSLAIGSTDYSVDGDELIEQDDATPGEAA